jgi:hypothetical protein
LKQVLTIVGKLKPSIELIQKIEATLKAFRPMDFSCVV